VFLSDKLVVLLKYGFITMSIYNARWESIQYGRLGSCRYFQPTFYMPAKVAINRSQSDLPLGNNLRVGEEGRQKKVF